MVSNDWKTTNESENFSLLCSLKPTLEKSLQNVLSLWLKHNTDAYGFETEARQHYKLYKKLTKEVHFGFELKLYLHANKNIKFGGLYGWSLNILPMTGAWCQSCVDNLKKF